MDKSFFSQVTFFRQLNAEEEKTFREWARLNFDPKKGFSPLWHPVVRDEWKKLQDEHGS